MFNSESLQQQFRYSKITSNSLGKSAQEAAANDEAICQKWLEMELALLAERQEAAGL